jgi:phosphatidylserine decarboxylase
MAEIGLICPTDLVLLRRLHNVYRENKRNRRLGDWQVESE